MPHLEVCLASAGRFHGFDLARQLARRGYLRRLYTGYPRWKIEGVPPHQVASFPWVIGPMMLLNQKGWYAVGRRVNWFATETFDRWLSSRLEPCHVFHFLSSFGMYAQRAAKHRYGALSVCDRGSSHILNQETILRQEFARWQFPYRATDPRIVERELKEYEDADLIVVPSEFAYRSFVERGVPPRKLVKIPYGVDLHVFRPVPKDDDIFRVLYVGAIRLEKGIPYLLQALASVRLPRFEVWLIGTVEEDARRFLAKYSGTFRAFGYIPRSQLYRYYSQGSVLVLPSLQEGLATVQAQAMACKLPIISTPNTGAEDLITDGVEGFIVPIRDPEAIREKVLYLYESREVHERMAMAALTRANALEGWDRYGALMIESYGTALKDRSVKTTASVAAT
jgi:starch synthase